MNKKILGIIIILAIIIILGLGIYLIKVKPVVNLNFNLNQAVEPTVKTAPGTMQSLITEIEKLSFNEINDNLNVLRQNLPFNYEGQNFKDENSILNFIALKIKDRENYTKDSFEKALSNYFLAGFGLPVLQTKKEYKDLNNYAFYKKYKTDCIQIISDDLNNYDLDSFMGNSSAGGGRSIAEPYYTCLASLNSNICDKLSGQNIVDKNYENSDKGEQINRQQECKNLSAENLFYYYAFLSQLPCPNIDFTKLGLTAQQLSFTDACQILRRTKTDLSGLNLKPSDKLLFGAYIKKDINACDDLGAAADLNNFDSNECKRNVALWLALEAKDIDKVKSLAQDLSKPSSQNLFMQFVLQNLEKVSAKLEAEVSNNSYNFNLDMPELKNFCQQNLQPLLEKNCQTAIKEIDSWFSAFSKI